MGREDAQDEVVRHLRGSRLVTLVGPGGVGKTRLALEVAAQLGGEGEPVVLVALEALSGPASVLPALASALGVPASPVESRFEAVAARVGDDRLVLVLDNAEHLRSGCASLAEALLGACGALRILATSRQRLGTTGEVLWPLPALSLSDDEPALPEAFVSPQALQLFCQRAAALRPGFLPAADNIEAIAEICRRLGGNPLAIELAATRVVALAPAEIAARLDDRFALLTGGPSTAPARQRSLRAALDWSHQLLSLPERALLRRLSVFPASFGLDAAEAVCGGDDVEPGQVLELLTSLVDKSLVDSEATAGTARFRLLETVRAYAAERLEEVGKTAGLAERHAAWCLALAEGGDGSRSGRDWVACLEAEQDNIRAALEWVLAEDRAELALRLVGGQMRLWERRGCFGEARECLERVLAATEAAPEGLRAQVLHDAGFAALMAGDLDAAAAHLRASLDLSAPGDTRASLRARTLLAFVATFGDDPATAKKLEGIASEVAAFGNDACLAEALAACGQARTFKGQSGPARAHFEASLQAARRSGHHSILATALVGLGSAELAQGDYPSAEDHLGESATLATGAGEVHSEVIAACWLAELAHLRGSHDEARRGHEECLERARAMSAPYLLALSLVGFGRMLLDQGEAEAALPLFDEAVAASRSAGLTHLVAVALAGGGQALALGDVAGARIRLDEALALARRRGDKAAEAFALEGWAQLSRLEGDASRASSRARQALVLHAEVGDPAAIARCLDALGCFTSDQGDFPTATRLLGAADSLRDRHACARPLSRRQEHMATVANLRHALGQEAFEAEWGRGEALSVEGAVDLAERHRGRRVLRPRTGWDALTRAERRVAELAALGHTNAEIAQELGVADATVKTHLHRVFVKLGVQTRASLAVEGARRVNMIGL